MPFRIGRDLIVTQTDLFDLLIRCEIISQLTCQEVRFSHLVGIVEEPYRDPFHDSGPIRVREEPKDQSGHPAVGAITVSQIRGGVTPE